MSTNNRSPFTMEMMRNHNALFAGLMTVDIIHRVDSFPQANQKIQAHQQLISAGGPATNAAVTYAALCRIDAQLDALLGPSIVDAGDKEDMLERTGDVACRVADKDNLLDTTVQITQGSDHTTNQCGRAQLYSAVGQGVLAKAARADIIAQGIDLIDCIPERIDALPTSLVMVESATGLRSVSGRNSVGAIETQMVDQGTLKLGPDGTHRACMEHYGCLDYRVAEASPLLYP